MSTIQSYFFIGVLIILALCIMACLVAAIKGPIVSDRMVAANMIGTLTIISICVLAWYLQESWLVDVALIYAMLSFIAVVVLTKIFIGHPLKKTNNNNSFQASSENEQHIKNGES